MMLDKIKDGADSILIIAKPQDIRQKIDESLKLLDFFPGLYASFSKPHTKILKDVEKLGLDKSRLYVIDMISKKEEEREEQAMHLARGDLTDLGIALSQFSQSIDGEKFIILDPLNLLLVYASEEEIERFAGATAAKSSPDGLKIVMFVMESEKEKSMIERIIPFFGEVIKDG